MIYWDNSFVLACLRYFGILSTKNICRMYQKSPVLLNEVINNLNIISDGVYIDATFGHGGHSKKILSYLNQQGRLLAIDRDYFSVKIGDSIAQKDRRLTMIYGRFSKLFKYMRNYNLIGRVNGILLDLGISRFQLENAERGFSFVNNGPLDMRMDTSCGLSASTWLRTASLEKIIWVLKRFGEEKFAKRIAQSIVMYRRYGGLLTHTHELVKLIVNAIPWFDKYKHPATRTFQAIRIYINNELEEIKKVLEDSLLVLAPRGRLLVISFHSLEDRIVKHFIQKHSYPISVFDGRSEKTFTLHNGKEVFFYKKNSCNQYHCYLKSISKIVPSKEEVKNNICSRSAILRCSEKIVI